VVGIRDNNTFQIGFVENQPTRFAGGQEISLFELIRGLALRGWSTQLWYAEHGDLLMQYQSFCESIYQIKSRQFHLRELVKITSDLIRITGLWKKKHLPDLIYCNQYFDTPFPTLVSQLLKIPLICHLRLAAPDYLSRQYKWSLTNADRLIAISKYAKTTYVDHGIPAEKITVLHNAVDVDYFASRNFQPQRTPTVIYVGRLSPNKGIELFVEAARVLLAEGLEYKFKIYGKARGGEIRDEDTYEEKLRNLAGSHLNEQILFMGHVDDVASIYAEADLLVLPTLWEAFGRVIIEAWASGLPVVANEVGGIPEIMKPDFDEFMISEPKVTLIASHIKRFVMLRRTSSNISDQLMEKARNQYSLSDYLPKLEVILRNTYKEVSA
jgi:glycosyltransferase involved in cell wall biosynthesis